MEVVAAAEVRGMLARMALTIDKKTPLTLLAVTIAVVVAILSYGAYDRYRERAQLETATTAVGEATRQLREALNAKPGGRDALAFATALDERANELDKLLAALHRVGAKPNRPLYAAAEMYVITTRELLRRLAAAHRHSIPLAHSRAVLQELLRQAGQRSPRWFTQAGRAKEQFERDAFDHRIAIEAMGNLLESLQAVRAELVPYVDAKYLIEDGLRVEAQQRARDAVKQVTEEVEQARSFAALR
jgi:hypothetical protein